MVDFICIGAQKAATTWLWAMLRQHPQIRFSPLKEVHYFDVIHLGTSRKKRIGKVQREVARQLRELKDATDPGSRARRDWLRGVADESLAFTDEWYRHLFEGQGAAVTGDITPLYSALPKSGIAHVKRLAPKVRLIYMIRDPVDRGASALRFVTRSGRSSARVLQSRRFYARGDYRRNIKRWESYFDPEQILYVPFGDVKRKPIDVLRSVERHIGVSAFDGYQDITSPVNTTAGRETAVTDEIMKGLVDLLADQRAFLEERFGQDFVSRTR